MMRLIGGLSGKAHPWNPEHRACEAANEYPALPSALQDDLTLAGIIGREHARLLLA
ncbi:hypothetical protein [Rhizobium freirei]|uniref:hypothetical protein n=1 Tax=Rhizobium freirei TaxID=1353277 RepID=UPI0003A95C1A|nr:hypothetical protein [Rhizobium freirei]